MSRKRKTGVASKTSKPKASLRTSRATSKAKTTKARTTTASNSRQSSLAEKTEQILLTMPKIIATQIKKDLSLLKQRALKLKTDSKKSDLQNKKLTKQIELLRKKNTPAAKKQLKKVQLSLQKSGQALKTLTQDSALVQKQHSALDLKKDKYEALHTQLLRFNKEWASKKPAKKPTAKKTLAKKTTQRSTAKPTPKPTLSTDRDLPFASDSPTSTTSHAQTETSDNFQSPFERNTNKEPTEST